MKSHFGKPARPCIFAGSRIQQTGGSAKNRLFQWMLRQKKPPERRFWLSGPA